MLTFRGKLPAYTYTFENLQRDKLGNAGAFITQVQLIKETGKALIIFTNSASKETGKGITILIGQFKTKYGR